MKNHSDKLQFYIATHNRPEFLLEALETILLEVKQEKNVEIVVSDNSSNHATHEVLMGYMSKITYIKRDPILTAIQHLNLIIHEASGEYLTIFHDDDMIMPGYVSKLRSCLNKDQSLAAAACNAYFIKGNRLTNETFWKNCSDELIMDPDRLVSNYIKITNINPPPFPSYMYRTKDINGLSLKKDEGGKYSDLTFLIKILKNKNIIWLGKPLIRYRLHATNDSKSEAIYQRLSLMRFIYKNTKILPKSKQAQEMRFLNWSRSLAHNKLFGRRKKIVYKFLIFYSLTKLPFKKSFWVKIYLKIILNAKS